MRRTFVGLVLLVRLWVTLSGLLPRGMGSQGDITCCLYFIYTRLEYNPTLDYLREDVMRLLQVKTRFWMNGKGRGLPHRS